MKKETRTKNKSKMSYDYETYCPCGQNECIHCPGDMDDYERWEEENFPSLPPVDLVQHRDVPIKTAEEKLLDALKRDDDMRAFLKMQDPQLVATLTGTFEEKVAFIVENMRFEEELEKQRQKQKEEEELEKQRLKKQNKKQFVPVRQDYRAPFDKRKHKEEEMLKMDFTSEEPVCKTDQTKTIVSAGPAKITHWKQLPRVEPVPIVVPVTSLVAPTPVVSVPTPVPTPVEEDPSWTVVSQAPKVSQVQKKPQRAVYQQCKYGMRCRNQDCTRAHRLQELCPNTCKFGVNCSMLQPDGTPCSRIHPNETLQRYANRMKFKFSQ